MARSDCTDLLACPVCGGPLADRGDRALCGAGHSFDFARAGYLNLATGHGGSGRIGDSAEMVRARARFLATGAYLPVAEAVGRAAAQGSGPVAEIGSGSGYYLGYVCDLLGGPGVGVDISTAAASVAARARPDLGFVVADAEERLPFPDGALGVVLSVFSPRPAAECARVLRPGGLLVAAFAEAGHLAGLRASQSLISIHPDKMRALEERVRPRFETVGTETVARELALSAEAAADLVAMGPSARHREADAEPPTGPVTDRLAVTVAAFRRLP